MPGHQAGGGERSHRGQALHDHHPGVARLRGAAAWPTGPPGPALAAKLRYLAENTAWHKPYG